MNFRKSTIEKEWFKFFLISITMTALMFGVLTPNLILSLSNKGMVLFVILQGFYCLFFANNYRKSLIKGAKIKPLTKFVLYAGLILIGLNLLGMPSFFLGMLFVLYLLTSAVIVGIQKFQGAFE